MKELQHELTGSICQIMFAASIFFGALVANIISQVVHMKQKNKRRSTKTSRSFLERQREKSAFKCFRLIYDCWRHYWESQVQQHAAFYCFSCKNNYRENLTSASATECMHYWHRRRGFMMLIIISIAIESLSINIPRRHLQSDQHRVLFKGYKINRAVHMSHRFYF